MTSPTDAGCEQKTCGIQLTLSLPPFAEDVCPPIGGTLPNPAKGRRKR